MGLCLPLQFRVYPEWKVNSSFINEHLNRALGLDAKPSSHPIEVDCPDANQIGQVRSLVYLLSEAYLVNCEDIRRVVVLQGCFRYRLNLNVYVGYSEYLFTL
jgi:hypothetical protein